MITLGSKVRDKISGFTGTVTGYAQYITGCSQVLVNPGIAKDGSMRDSIWLDEQRLVVDKKVKPIVLDNGSNPGCDIAPPVR